MTESILMVVLSVYSQESLVRAQHLRAYRQVFAEESALCAECYYQGNYTFILEIALKFNVI